VGDGVRVVRPTLLVEDGVRLRRQMLLVVDGVVFLLLFLLRFLLLRSSKAALVQDGASQTFNQWLQLRILGVFLSLLLHLLSLKLNQLRPGMPLNKPQLLNNLLLLLLPGVVQALVDRRGRSLFTVDCHLQLRFFIVFTGLSTISLVMKTAASGHFFAYLLWTCF
jgi:hypothetical protein